MIKISKNEKEYLVKNGCKWKEDVHRTYSNGSSKTYYATESRNVLKMLDKYRKNVTVESH